MRAVLLLLLLAAPAHAGIGSLFRLAAQAGKVAGKGASVAGRAGALGKAAAVTTKASSLAIGLRVLSHLDDPARVAVFIAREGDDALRVVTHTDDVVQGASGVRRTLSELDAMAAVADDAGVDVFVHPNALGALHDLQPGPNTRLFLADGDLAPRPIQAVAGRQVAVQARGGWVRLSVDAAFDAVSLMPSPVTDPEVVVVAEGCGDGDLDAALAGDGAVVILAGPGVHPSLDGGRDDLVILELDAVCDGPELLPEVAAARDAARDATELGDLWSLGQPVELTWAVTEAGRVQLAGVHPLGALRASHRTGEASGDPMAIAVGAIAGGLALIVLLILRARRKDR